MEQICCVLQIDGSYKFKIAVSDLQALFGTLSNNMFGITVDVTETMTGNTLSGTADIKYYSRLEKLAFLEGATNFKPGMEFSSYVCICYYFA